MKFRILDKLIKRIAKRLWYNGASGSWKAIFSLLERREGCTLLDLGCNDGSSTMLVAAHVNAGKVIGVDLDDEALKKAEEKGILTYKADLNERLPFDGEYVDIVFANQVIEHLINVDNFVSEIYRVLRKGVMLWYALRI